MPKLTKAARAALLAAGADDTDPTFPVTGPTEDYHPPVVDEFVDADGEHMVELLDGNIEPAADWIQGEEDEEPADGSPPGEEPGEVTDPHVIIVDPGPEVVGMEIYDAPEGGNLVEDYTPPRPELPKLNRTVKPATLIHGTKNPYMSGFCLGEHRDQADSPAAQLMHSQCKGGVISGVHGQVILCQCPGHDGENRCIICRTVNTPETFDADFRVCLDQDACTDALHTQAIESSKTPLSRMIRQVKAQSRRGAETAEDVGGQPKAPRAPRAPREKREGRPCQCGCALITGGGLFRPGHDAKLKGILKKAAKDGDVAAYVEQLARGWSPVLPDVPLGSVEQTHLASEQAKQDYIETRVAARYAAADSSEEN